jgi:predicted phage tail protein
MTRLTKEREAEIREVSKLEPWRHLAEELLSGIDALRAEKEERNKWVTQQSHLLQETIKERDQLKCEVRAYQAALAAVKEAKDKYKAENEKLQFKYDSIREMADERVAILKEENQKLHSRVTKLRGAIQHVHKHANPDFGWGDLLREALAQDGVEP